MRAMLATVDMDGVVVIGEGEKDHAPMLHNGEHIGNGTPPLVDVAVDPVDGTRPTAEGVLGPCPSSPRRAGAMYAPGRLVYMEKIAVGRRRPVRGPGGTRRGEPAPGGRRQGKAGRDLTAIILDRPRNLPHIEAVRRLGGRIRLIRDGDISAAIAAAVEDSGIDILLGIGGSPER